MADENKQNQGTGNASQQPQPPVVVKGEEEVKVPKSLLKQILDRQELQDQEIARLKRDKERLEHAADKGRLAQWDNDHAEGLVRRAKVSLWDNKIVLAWKMVKDEVGKVDGVLREVQIIQLYLKDDKAKDGYVTKDVGYLDFARNVKKLEGDVVEESKIKGVEHYRIKFEDGQEVKLDIKYIN